MKQRIDFHQRLSPATKKDQQIASFALLCLGVIESLADGTATASGAVELFFHPDNCLFVCKTLRQKVADEIMSRGVQLPDIFEALSAEEAQQEFQQELAAMRSLGLKLLEPEEKPLAA